ncbi:hypothetical protein BDZ89DRAFT_374744 [Hymenopellis radicata]|nr:hypothetical protein BDZ89DRAFT_374744 [Hymenopellis radicata]
MPAVWPRAFRRFPQRGGRWQLVLARLMFEFADIPRPRHTHARSITYCHEHEHEYGHAHAQTAPHLLPTLYRYTHIGLSCYCLDNFIGHLCTFYLLDAFRYFNDTAVNERTSFAANVAPSIRGGDKAMTRAWLYLFGMARPFRVARRSLTWLCGQRTCIILNECFVVNDRSQ